MPVDLSEKLLRVEGEFTLPFDPCRSFRGVLASVSPALRPEPSEPARPTARRLGFKMARLGPRRDRPRRDRKV
jgi:hypothetical protein